MRGARTTLLTLCLIAAGCGDLFEGPTAGGTGGTGGTSGDPRFVGDCSNGPLGAPLANCQPDPIESTGDPYADYVTRINQLRWECQCLPPLQRWTEAEGGRSLFWFVLLADLTPSDILESAVWQVAGRERRYPLLSDDDVRRTARD